VNTEKAIKGCQCGECKEIKHSSDCAVHNEPAMDKGKCTCGAERIYRLQVIQQHLNTAYYETDAETDIEFLLTDIKRLVAILLINKIDIAALRAQQEKENPKLCEYCRADSFPKLLIEGGEQSIWFNADTGKFRESTFYGDGDMDWAHCPMCGRKLEPKEAR
jgi:hypothetical protein